MQEHGFFVRPERAAGPGRCLLIAATSTWIAYNDWGGANHYHGDKVPAGMRFAPRLTIHRPWAIGLIWLPQGARATRTTMQFRDGLPYPTLQDGAPCSVEIVAMGLPYNREEMRGRRGEASYDSAVRPPATEAAYRRIASARFADRA